MSNILVTGGAGYIGSMLVPNLLCANHNVTVIDNFMYNQTSLASSISNKNFELVFGDVRNEDLMKKLISKADVIIPLAAIVGAPACDNDPLAAESINKDSILWLLKQVSSSQQIIMPTTNSAYGSGDQNNYCDENSPLNPLSIYARDKVIVEKALMERENSTSFRLATVFGISPRMRLDLLVNNFTFRALTDRFVIVFEGHFKRNYIHIRDVVQAFNLAIDEKNKFKGEIFNVGLSEANISKIDLCKEIKEKIKGQIEQMGGVDSVQIESSTDKTPLTPRLKADLESKGYSGDNKGLSKARSNAIRSFLMSLGINPDNVTVVNLADEGKEGGYDPSARYFKLILIEKGGDTGGSSEYFEEGKEIVWLQKIVGGLQKKPREGSMGSGVDCEGGHCPIYR